MCSVYCVGLYLDLFLHAGDHHGVLDCVGLDIHLLPHMLFWGENPGVGLDLHHLLLASDHRDVLD